jgi:DNA-binding transcriptional MerR regulator
MAYTIAKAAEKFGLTAHTLRFYDKEGLLPWCDRNAAGVRVFKDSDDAWLQIITCLKGSGMPIKKIKEYVELGMKGDTTLEERFAMIKAHKKEVEAQLEELQRHMELLGYKEWYYETAIKAGTEAIHKNDTFEMFKALLKKGQKDSKTRARKTA